MARKIPEWIGKNDDAVIPNKVKDRVCERQGNRCAISNVPFGPKCKPQFDHKTPLWLGGEHRESNLQAISEDEHKKKTAAEAKIRAKVDAQRMKHLGIKGPKGSIKSAGFPKSDKQPRIDKSALPPLPKARLFTSADAERHP